MSFWSPLLRALGLVSEPLAADQGAEFASGEVTHQPAYDATNAMSAALVFSWVYAVAVRRASDLAALPIRVYRQKNGQREELPDHWLSKLLKRPNSYTDGEVFRRDLVVDLILDGNATSAVLGPGTPVRPVSLQRWFPARVELLTDRGGPVGWAYNLHDTHLKLPLDRVLHARMPSFRDGPRGLFWGTGMIEPLHTELEAEYHTVKRAREQMARGRPDFVISPKNGRNWSKAQREDVQSRVEKMTKKGGGAIVASDEADIKPLSWNMRDMEGQELRTYTREGVLACGRTPPVLVGLPTANYATSENQDLKYWESQQADGRLFDACFWTQLLRLAGETDTVAETDFSGIKALQSWKSSAVQQATTLWMMGVDRDVALRSVGLGDVAAAQAQAEKNRPPPPKPPPVTTTTSTPESTASTEPPRLHLSAAELWFRGYRSPSTETDRAALWNDWLERVHTPSERNLGLVMVRHFKDQAARLAARLGELYSSRADDIPVFSLEELLLQLWDDLLEEEGLKSTLEGPEREAAKRAYAHAIRSMGLSSAEIKWKPADAESEAIAGLAENISKINATTRRALATILEDSLNGGASVSEMQAAIQKAAGFSPARALGVARTETTRTAKDGTLPAYRRARDAGVQVKKGWLAERDGVTRPEHLALDGQVVGVDEMFVVPVGPDVAPVFVGSQADGPGGFVQVALVANCRCALTPVVEPDSEETAA